MDEEYLLVRTDALPDVFLRVMQAKRLLREGKASSASEAAVMAGVSRSAFYKYKDSVMPYNSGTGGTILTVHATLSDRPGALSLRLPHTGYPRDVTLTRRLILQKARCHSNQS